MAPLSDESASDRQITFGHFLILSVMSSLLILICIILWRVRFRKQVLELRCLPRSGLPLQKKYLSKRQNEVIMQETIHRLQTEVHPLPGVGCQLGWSQPAVDSTGEAQGIHFKDVIARSHFVVEEAMVHRCNCSRLANQTVPEYIYSLAKFFPNFDYNLCDSFVNAYKRARFSKDEISERDYERFMDKLLQLVQALESAPMNPTESG
eukprot:GCRY01003173.1.p1 GENE.GCRY01003173.1~~GCRY01003173.1.p1  ORF type:complete len:207 (+),score=7.95 GCRY01003173.1:118-738(+)